MFLFSILLYFQINFVEYLYLFVVMCHFAHFDFAHIFSNFFYHFPFPLLSLPLSNEESTYFPKLHSLQEGTKLSILSFPPFDFGFLCSNSIFTSGGLLPQ